MAKGKVSPELIEQFKQIVGEKYVYTDKEKLEPYAHDEVTDPHYMKEPQVVVLPATTEEVSKVVKLCYETIQLWFRVLLVRALQPVLLLRSAALSSLLNA